MKERLHRIVDGLTEAQVMYVFTFLTRLFGKDGAEHG